MNMMGEMVGKAKSTEIWNIKMYKTIGRWRHRVGDSHILCCIGKGGSLSSNGEEMSLFVIENHNSDEGSTEKDHLKSKIGIWSTQRQQRHLARNWRFLIKRRRFWLVAHVYVIGNEQQLCTTNPFVIHRIEEIQTPTEAIEWIFVSGQLNTWDWAKR